MFRTKRTDSPTSSKSTPRSSSRDKDRSSFGTCARVLRSPINSMPAICCFRKDREPDPLDSDRSLVPTSRQNGHFPSPKDDIDPSDRAEEVKAWGGDILTSELVDAISPNLPFDFRNTQRWHLAYSTRRHGTSTSTFYNQQRGPNVLLVQDSQGGVFGGFSQEPWQSSLRANSPTAKKKSPMAKNSKQSPEFFPTSGESFVFRTLQSGPRGSTQLITCRPRSTGPPVHWMDNSTVLAMGEALIIKADFMHGSSVCCQRFGAALSSEGTNFVVRNFECWCFEPSNPQREALRSRSNSLLGMVDPDD
eukprot:gnl/MRDRNA2_/MRDRNA2_76324_c0_seq1.p1 gnl/MRDRNA2_/MRDRNA2_76324_c0~~gnl/MRDRNA2_/MRDRNA2_76324_c0_seq1.p1  ORF type:complete len:305 (+),score=24.92 gnl/MRDRNA2_/MRDRNA2_76324_c0_seq1:60-974(+)